MFKAQHAQAEAELARGREQEQRHEAEQQRLAAETSAAGERQQRLRVEALAYSTDMNLVLLALERNNLGRARDLLNRNRPAPDRPDRRGWEWRYLWNQSRSDELTTMARHDRYVFTTPCTWSFSNVRSAALNPAAASAGAWPGPSQISERGIRQAADRGPGYAGCIHPPCP